MLPDSVNNPDALEIGHIFLVGGFAESPVVQEAIREAFKGRVKVIIPQVSFQTAISCQENMSNGFGLYERLSN